MYCIYLYLTNILKYTSWVTKIGVGADKNIQIYSLNFFTTINDENTAVEVIK